ncbi:hypothetical protein BgiBS90_029649 [Biomphalaria glabrata]|nr:hypothetical protein BgiBS90_029649 [Biomphalaria glabrata]
MGQAEATVVHVLQGRQRQQWCMSYRAGRGNSGACLTGQAEATVVHVLQGRQRQQWCMSYRAGRGNSGACLTGQAEATVVHVLQKCPRAAGKQLKGPLNPMEAISSTRVTYLKIKGGPCFPPLLTIKSSSKVHGV